MFTALCKHAHSDWQSTEVFLYVIGKSNIIQTRRYIIVINSKGKHNFKHFYYVHFVEIPTQKGRALMKMYRVVPQTKRGNCMYMY